ncbi:SDR family NAD(P)-dependent oxidoreductase [Nitratireductor basaltis]|uniref:3-oxoacyl-ACP reductase n=1 Tax=Nitratireductor basaltis TaxID=472175 RepID=A0A084U564_9HYPH|nr:SDR family NAD(P)-dependent oxidoreductase [Nitratireductor basaltis]KFB08100.1 3-oxoacyl-ACP reductase [Nitratireductor basaltis]
MSTKTILVTGATDGLGLAAAKKLAAKGHRLFLHGRDQEKLEAAKAEISGEAETLIADLSNMTEVNALADKAAARAGKIDVLINNAGVFKADEAITPEGLDIRFAVNTLAPYLLTRLLLPSMPKDGRVVSLSSAAQEPVDIRALKGNHQLGDMDAYAQSKLALIIWTKALAAEHPDGPTFIALNPGSLLATKMVREGFGIDGSDVNIGGDIITEAALSDDFADRSGEYYDNDGGGFSEPHPAALDVNASANVMEAIKELVGLG